MELEDIDTIEEKGVSVAGELLRLPDAAKRLGVSKRTLYRYIDKGYFPNVVKADPFVENSHYLIPVSDVEDFEELRKKSRKG
jgi:predicted site-specific integrase-resolvase